MQDMLNAERDPEVNQVDQLEGSEEEENQNDYYSDFARRVYFLAEREHWNKEKTLRYFNDREGFEKYYNNVSEKLPLCARRFLTLALFK